MAKRDSGLRFQPTGGTRAPQIPVGKKQRLTIERLANDGRGVAFNDGKTWFVSAALPGEDVEARVLGARGKIVEARTERVFAANALRQPPDCRYFDECGGCNLQHLPRAEQLALKQQQLAEHLDRVAGLAPLEWAPPLFDADYGYRRRARIAVRWDVKTKHLDVGFRAEASQRIVDIADCPVLVPALQPLMRELPDVLRQFDKPQTIGHVELFHGTATVVLLRHIAPLTSADNARLQAFCHKHEAQLWLQGEGAPQSVEANVQLGYRLAPWHIELAYRPGDFIQVNEALNIAMISQALAWLAPQAHERVLDLFCGLGNFALPLARQAGQVVGVEGVEAMVERARNNAQTNGIDNATFFQADLAQPLTAAEWSASGFDVVLLDPPRDGALEVVKHVARLGAKRLLYVSCNPATLARDTVELSRQGYRLTRAGILDMFPQTAHVEAMALFEMGQEAR